MHFWKLKERQGNTMVKTAAENILWTPQAWNHWFLSLERFLIVSCECLQLWRNKDPLKYHLKPMFYPAYSPANTALPLPLFHRLSSGDKIYPRWSSARLVRVALWRNPGQHMAGYMDTYLGTAPCSVRPARAFLSAGRHGLHKSISFQPFWAHSSSFSS